VVSPRPVTTGANIPITSMASIVHFGHCIENVTGNISPFVMYANSGLLAVSLTPVLFQ